MPYEPREDSFLLRKYVQKYSKGKVLDMGTGSGIQAQEAAEKADFVLAVDIDEKAVDYCEKNIKNEKINFIVSDLFEKVRGKFDLIVFNPPYLPEDEFYDETDKALTGGVNGWELLERFLKKAKNYLNKNGNILIIFSSLTNLKKAKEIMKDYNYKKLEESKLPFEKLYVYLLKITGK
ncbi:methyltransferase [Candidatus Woesearchaeota archaeon]|nr:methyltransferase [Candidatus Woesearchaeota archaeon]